MTEIIENLWLGTAVNASDKNWLRSKGISGILNLSKEVPMFFPSEFSYRKLDPKVNGDEEFIKEFKFMNEFIDKNRKKGAVLVHCMLESTVSTAAVIAYFIFKEKMDYAAARNLVRKRKRDARLDERFARILKEYQVHLAKKREFKKMVLKQHINLRNSVRLLGDEDDKDSYFSLLNTPQRLSKEEVEKIKKHLESKTVYEKGKIFDTDRAGEFINLSELGIQHKHIFPKSQFSPDNFSSPEQVPKSAGSLKLDPISSNKKPGRKNTIEIKVSNEQTITDKEYLVTSYSSMKNLGDDPSPFKDIRDYITPTRSHKKRKVESIKNLKKELVNSINGLSEGLRSKYAKLDKVLNNLIRATPNYRRSPKFQKSKVKKKKKKRRGINLDNYGYKSSFADSISVLTNIRKTSKNNPNNIYSQRNIYSSRTLGRRERADIGNVTIWQKMIQKKMQDKASDSNKKTYRPVKIQEVNNFSEFDKVRKLMRWSAPEEFESPPFKSSIGVRSKEENFKRSYKSPFATKKHASSLKKSKKKKISKNSEHLRRVLNLDTEETSKEEIAEKEPEGQLVGVEEANHKLLMEQRSSQDAQEQQKQGMALFMMTA